MDALQVLKQAKALIQDESNWTKGVLARDRQGMFCLPCEESATCFCSLGAVYRVVGVVPADYEEIVLDRAAGDLYGEDVGIVDVNDKMNHEDVMAVFDKAINDLEKEQAQ